MNFSELKKNNLFLLGLIIKLTLSVFFASYFLSDLFAPFVIFFVKNLQSPYIEFYLSNSPESFPYPALMLYLTSLPLFLADIFVDVSLLSNQLHYFLLRLPLIASDIGILLILNSWMRGYSTKKLILLYWFSPVLIYISYIHGQLDVIPIFFLFLSLDCLFKKKILYSGIIFGLAVSSKTMVLLSFPFIAMYLVSQERNLKNVFVYLVSAASIFFLINLPFLFDPIFQQMVFKNIEQDRIFQLSIAVGGSSFYFIPACLLLLLVRGALINNFNRDIFIMFLGFAFGIILIFISPMQGWYFWLIPFLTYFYAKSDDNSFIWLLVLQLAYLLYFAISEQSDYLQVFTFNESTSSFYTLLSNMNIDAAFIKGISFTILQVALGVNCFQIYRKGIDSYSKHKITSKPFLLGIGGNSGAGKTTISENITNIFTPLNSLVIRGDDMHKWQRGHEKWEEFTHLNPKANLLHEEIVMLNNLKSGKKISRKTYDHDEGIFTKALSFTPKNLIIFEGLHPFYLSRQRQLYDLKIFIKPEKDLANHWKIMRDTLKRGYTKEKVLKNLQDREQDSKNFIESQSKYADILISPHTLNPIKDIGNPSEIIEIAFNLIMSNSIYLENIIDDLNSTDKAMISQTYLDEDKQKISINGGISPELLSVVANQYIPELSDLGVDYPNWRKDAFGVVTLLVTYFIFEAAEYGKE